MSALFGDELALRTDFATVDSRNNTQVLGLVMRYIRQANEGASPLQLARLLAQGVLTAPKMMKEEFAGFCEIAERLAERLGFGESIIRALGHVFERWDGRGTPAGLKGEQIAPSMRVVALAQDVITFHRLDGAGAAVAIAKERKGTVYDPRMVELFCRQAPQ